MNELSRLMRRFLQLWNDNSTERKEFRWLLAILPHMAQHEHMMDVSNEKTTMLKEATIGYVRLFMMTEMEEERRKVSLEKLYELKKQLDDNCIEFQPKTEEI
jgi:hypothetical protein